MNNNQEGVFSILSVADLLRGDYKRSGHGGVVLRLTVMRHLECVLRPKIGAVRETACGLPKKTDEAKRDLPLLLAAAKEIRFENTSKFVLHPSGVAKGE